MSRIILIADPDESGRAPLARALSDEGFDVLEARDGQTTLDMFEMHRPDLVVLELRLPRVGGLDVCRAIRARSAAPIAMLTAPDADVDRIVALELGADDVVTKPANVRELVARIRALFRRCGVVHPSEPQNATAVEVRHLGRVTIDERGHRLIRDGAVLPVTPKAFQLLLFFLRNPGQVFTREQLLDQVWGYDYAGETRTVNVHVSWLRTVIEDDPGNPVYLQTVRGVGYILRLDRGAPDEFSAGIRDGAAIERDRDLITIAANAATRVRTAPAN